ncbi:MAG: hypothetical protein IKU29_08365 [Parabacteroides sp.]|nr:hypothetical protein [Parabacteroides sp.]
MIPPIVIGRRAVDQVIVGTMKQAGCYLMDITDCGKSYHLGRERWVNFVDTQEPIDRDWNARFYTKEFIRYHDMTESADYVITRYSLVGFLYAGRNKKGLKKLIPKPYRLESKNRALITPR